MKQIIKSAANAVLSPLQLKLVRKDADQQGVNLQDSMPTCDQRLAHAKSIGFAPTQIIDAGAFMGTWTTDVGKVFPQASFLVIEPNPHIQSQLSENLADCKDRVQIIPKAVADEVSTMPFHIWGDPNEATSASLQAHIRGEAEHTVDVAVDTIDRLMAEHQWSPQLIKLDLQGAELKALRGCTDALKTAEMFVVEFGCLQAYIDRTTPRQLMEIFYDNDYCLYDIVDCHYRPYDGALTGGDFFFVKNSSALKSHANWD